MKVQVEPAPDTKTYQMCSGCAGCVLGLAEAPLKPRTSVAPRALKVVSGPNLRDMGTLPSPYSLYRYFTISSDSCSTVPAQPRQPLVSATQESS